MESPHRVLYQCKTATARRTIDIPDKLYEHLKELKKEQEENRKFYGKSYKANENVKVRLKANQNDNLRGGDFINRQKNGQLLTSDSMKSWAVKIEKELGIHFRYHNLRHPYVKLKLKNLFSLYCRLNCAEILHFPYNLNSLIRVNIHFIYEPVSQAL